MLLLEDIKKSVQVAAHYTTHIGIAPSSYLTGLSIIKNMYQRLRVTATHLCRIFLAPHLNFNICFQYSFVSTSAKGKSRCLMAYPQSGSTYSTRPVRIGL